MKQLTQIDLKLIGGGDDPLLTIGIGTVFGFGMNGFMALATSDPFLPSAATGALAGFAAGTVYGTLNLIQNSFN